MRILFIDQYAGGPSLGMEFRTQYLAREWQSHGHEVGVVTGTFSHLRRQQLPPGEGVIDGMRFLALRTPSYPGNGPRRFLNILAFHLGLRRAEGRLAGWAPDVVVAASTHPLDVRSALRIARAAGAAMVYEVRDLWPLTPQLLSDMSDRHPMIRWMQREEDLGYRECDLTVSLLPLTKPYMVRHGLDAAKWRYLPNGVPEPQEPQPPGPTAQQHIERIEELRRSGFPVIVAYAGTQGPANALGRLLSQAAAAEALGIGLVLIGDGPDGPQLQETFGKRANVMFLERVPRADVPAILEHADVGYAGLAPSPLYEYGIGMNKVWDYMAAGLPILECIDSPHSPTLDAGCGWRADSADPYSLPTAFEQIVASGPGRRRAMGEAGRAFVLERFTEPRIADAYLAELTALVTPSGD